MTRIHPDFRRIHLLLAALIAIACLLLPTPPAAAQSAAEEEHAFDIASQPLSDALARFGTQAGVQVSVRGELVRAMHSPGVSGTMSASAALGQLLAGTALTYRFDGDTAVITAVDANGGSVLAPIQVTATAADDRHFGNADRVNSIYVNHEALERRRPVDVKDVFSGESGVQVGGAQPLSQKVYVDGVEENNLAVSIDGARQNNKIFHHNATNVIDPSLLKLARVDPGVAPADAGPGALGGAIAYETIDVGDVLAPGDGAGGFATIDYNDNGDTLAGALSAYGRSDGFEILGYIKSASGDEYEDGDGNEVPGTETDMGSYLVKAAHESADGHRFELSAENVEDDAQRPFRANIGRLPARPDPVTRVYDIDRSNYVLSYSFVGDGGLWAPTFLVGESETSLAVPEPYGSVGSTGSFSGKIENDFAFAPGRVLTAGIDYYDDEASYSDPETPKVSEKASNVGIYAQARLEDVGPVDLSFGLRGDSQDFEGVDGTRMDNSGVSGNASVVFNINENVSLNAGYADTWGGIALAENFIFNPNWTYTDIDPVESESYSYGATMRTGRVSLDARVFKTELTNVRDENYRGGPSLTADFESEGYSFGLGLHWTNGFVRFSYTDSEISIDGESTDSDTSQYFGAPIGQIIDIEVAHRIERLNLAFGGVLEAALENSDGGGFAEQPLESYEVLNLYAEYRPQMTGNPTFRVELNNVFDEVYADRATYGQDFASVEPLREPGRSLMLRARFEF